MLISSLERYKKLELLNRGVISPATLCFLVLDSGLSVLGNDQLKADNVFQPLTKLAVVSTLNLGVHGGVDRL